MSDSESGTTIRLPFVTQTTPATYHGSLEKTDFGLPSTMHQNFSGQQLGNSVMGEEVFDVCDEHDNVIGQAPRSVVHRNHDLHRAVHIWVFNSRGELLMHLRSATKDEFPSTYTSSASGHLSAGETYDDAAARELEEELGIKAALTRVTKLPATKETAYEHTVLYRCQTDQTPVPDPNEVAEVTFLPLTKVAELARNHPEKLSPPFRQLVEWFVRNTDLPS